jgi:CRP/FNR family transcriptional regulator, dissimilatory nitrate respiration regulator
MVWLHNRKFAMNAVPLSLSRISEIINRLDYFHGLGAETLEQLAGGARQVALRRGETVFRKGMPADALHIVVSGQVKVFLSQPNAGEKVVALVERGESFGVASLWLGGAHLADALANKDSHLLIIDRQVLMRGAHEDCVLAGRLMDAVSRRVVDLMRNLESCSPRSAQQRVACYLSQRRPTVAGHYYDVLLPTTKREVATKLNLTQETFSRVLRQLAEEGVIEVRGRLIRVLAAARMEALNTATRSLQME